MDYRFELVNPDGVEFFHDGSPEVYLSKAVTRATRLDATHGVWEVYEWGTRMYAVERLASAKMTVVIS